MPTGAAGLDTAGSNEQPEQAVEDQRSGGAFSIPLYRVMALVTKSQICKIKTDLFISMVPFCKVL